MNKRFIGRYKKKKEKVQPYETIDLVINKQLSTKKNKKKEQKMFNNLLSRKQILFQGYSISLFKE